MRRRRDRERGEREERREDRRGKVRREERANVTTMESKTMRRKKGRK